MNEYRGRSARVRRVYRKPKRQADLRPDRTRSRRQGTFSQWTSHGSSTSPITESAHRIHNPFTAEKLATLGTALRLESGARVLDLASGSGEMLCTWARDHGVVGTGVDLSQLFSSSKRFEPN